MPRLVACLLCLLAVSGSARAESTEHWTEVRSPHFIVLTDANEKQGRRVAGQFERMRSLFQSVLPYASFEAAQPITVLAVKDRKAFNSIEPAAYLAKGSLQLAGLFLRTQERNFILLRLDTEDEHPYSIVYHEYTHFILRKAEWLPLWLNEGFAEFYEYTDILDKSVRLGQPSTNNIMYLRENRMIPLTTLFAVDHTSPYYHEEQKGSVFYAESWALVHFLEVTDFTNKTRKLQTYAHLLAQGGNPVSAAQQAFGDLNVLDKQLNAYVQNGDYKLFNFNLAITADEASYTARALPTPEADAVRADVLANNQRENDAKALIETVLREDPKNARAHETMGFIALHDHDEAEARTSFGEAVELGTDSPFAYYFYATSLLQTDASGKDDSIEASLRKAIALDPEYAPPYEALGRFYGMRKRNLEEASELMHKAALLEPGEVGFRINMAYLYVQRDMPDAAIRVLTAAESIAKNQQEKDVLQERIASYRQFEERKAAFEKASAPGGVLQGSDGTGTQPSTDSTTTVMLHGASTTVQASVRKDISASLPSVPASAPHRTARGVLRNVQCSYPTVLTLALEEPGKTLTLFSPDMYKVTYSTVGYIAHDAIDPCTALAGMKAKIDYAEVNEKNMSGEVLAVELSK